MTSPIGEHGRAMGPILHVVSEPDAAAALCEALTRLGWTNRVATLCESDLGRIRGVDPRPWLNLRRRIRDVRPSVIHAWGIHAARVAVPITRRPVIVSDANGDERLGGFDRWLLQRSRVVVAPIPPCVAEPVTADRAAAIRALGLPATARIIACSGTIERGHGFIEASWVFDILKYVYPDLWLLVLGDGPHRARVEEFARSLAREDYRVCFAGTRPDAASLLSLAEVVWILGERGGFQAVFEALAAGRPVVARRRNDLSELLGNGETGFLVPNADRHEVARATRRILDDAELRRRFETAAKLRAAEFAPKRMAPRWAELYAQLSRAP